MSLAAEKSGLKNHSDFLMFSDVNPHGEKSDLDLVQPDNCIVTLKASVFMGFFSIEVSCSGTGASCQIATQRASSCLSTAINTVKKSVT